MLCFRRLICDGWSLPLLLADFAAISNTFPRLESDDLPIQPFLFLCQRSSLSAQLFKLPLRDADAAIRGADVVMTDTGVSMNDKGGDRLRSMLRPYQVDRARMELAAADALFLHCLPAHRGEEVTAEVIDGPASVVWTEAENRIHAQKAILTWCLA